MKLSDIQLILLTTASQRQDGNLLPPPDSIGTQAARIKKAVAALLKAELATEVDAADATSSWREDGDRRVGVVITEAGRQAIGAGDPVDESLEAVEAPQLHIESPAEPRQTKAGLVLAMLQRGEGATLPQLIDATGWLPHTTRAALTGLRKKGHVLAKDKQDGVTTYRIGEVA